MKIKILFFFFENDDNDESVADMTFIREDTIHKEKNRSIDRSRGDTIDGDVPCSVTFLADRTRIEEAIPLGWEHVVARDTSATRCPETRRRGTKASELVVLRPTELVVGDEAILVLVLVLEDLLNEFVVVGHYLLHLLAVPAAPLLRLDHLFPQVLAHLRTPD